jgi:hypothetical protein
MSGGEPNQSGMAMRKDGMTSTSKKNREGKKAGKIDLIDDMILDI